MYRMKYIDELLGYLWLRKDVTGIDADIYVDDCDSYIRDGHEPLLFVVNGVCSGDISDFIPVSLSEEPNILDNSIDIKLSDGVIDDVFLFIKKNRTLLMSFSSGKVNVIEFFKIIRQNKIKHI